jgi:peptidyl-prolyl cis-trans isomerase C
MSHAAAGTQSVACINGVPLNSPGESLGDDELRQRACTELLRQAAQNSGLLAGDDAYATDGVISESAAAAIETLLDDKLDVPEPSEEACQRHYAANQGSFSTGEKIHARHILFAVTPGVDVVALRKRAEAALLDVRCHDGNNAEVFAKAARELSNCPSGSQAGMQGGDLGWLTRNDCAPEFAQELFGHAEIGVLPRLVHSRFGLHVVEVLQREPGVAQSFESVRGAVTMSLRQKAYVTALRQYMRLLAAQASMEGVELEAADKPAIKAKSDQA